MYFLALSRGAIVAFGVGLLLLVPEVQAQNTAASGKRALSPGKVGDTELHWAAYRGHSAVVERLLQNGAPVDQRVNKGSTPLHLAAYKGHVEVVALLLEHGADVNARNEDGITPLDWARSNSHPDTEALLLAGGAVVGKPLPVKSQARQQGVASAAAANPGRYLLSNSGQYRARPPRDTPPEVEAHDAVVERPIRQDEIDRLESVSQINQIVENYRHEQARQITGTADKAALQDAPQAPPENQLAENTPQQKALPVNAYRIQLAALSDYGRAQALRVDYAQRYRDILGEHTLVVEADTSSERALYRLRSSALAGGDAASVCEKFKRRSLDCIVVAGSPARR